MPRRRIEGWRGTINFSLEHNIEEQGEAYVKLIVVTGKAIEEEVSIHLGWATC